MPKPTVILRVSEIYAWGKRGRVFPGLIVRAIRKNAECMALLKVRTASEQLELAAKDLNLLPLVREARVRPTDNGFELVVYSWQRLVTQRDRQDFIAQVRYHLAQPLNAKVAVEHFSFR
jgi:hypothetical protein